MKPRLGFQMINLHTHSDFKSGLHKARAMGYEIAEPWSWNPPVSCLEQHRLGKEAGLQICSAHYNPKSEWVEPALETLADQLAVDGARAWVMPGGYTGSTLEAMREGAARLRAFYQQILAPRGLGLEYHNHSTDVMPLFDGKSQVDILLEEVPELGFQADIGNAFLGGQTDTLSFLRHYGTRITCLHIKDIRKDHALLEKGKGTCVTGEGVIDVAGAVTLARSFGVRDYIIEQEGFISDTAIEEMLASSHDFVRPLLKD